jgi:outer membrane protein insertion porin family/translocation and assembly module TamA
VGNIEVRLRPGGPGSIIQLVGFLDAGALWQRGATTDDLRFAGIALTPGIGVRAFTPVGPVRLDIGYNPYAPRAGTAYRDTPLGLASAPLYCVSPGNTLKVTGAGAVDASGNPIPPVQEAGACPATFAPAPPGNFFDRLVLHFSIGQAF